jgi:hypothetical protein
MAFYSFQFYSTPVTFKINTCWTGISDPAFAAISDFYRKRKYYFNGRKPKDNDIEHAEKMDGP